MLAVNCNMFYQTGSVFYADKSDVIQIKHYVENLTDCYILCLLTAFTSAEHFPSDVYLACLKFFPSRLHVVTHMWNIPHIKLLKQKYEMQNINVFFIFLGPLQFHCDSETDSSRVTQWPVLHVGSIEWKTAKWFHYLWTKKALDTYNNIISLLGCGRSIG